MYLLRMCLLLSITVVLAACGATPTPNCASPAVLELFRDQVVMPTIENSLIDAERSVNGSAENKFLQPIFIKRLEIGNGRRDIVREGFTLTNIRTVKHDEETDTYTCQANMNLPGLNGEVYSKDLDYNVYSIEKPDDHFELEYGDWVEAFVVDMLFQPKVDLSI